MSMEYLPATAGSGPEIVLLHGWANNREVWRPLLARLRGWANVTLLDLPGLAPGLPARADCLDEIVAELLGQCPDQALYIGWSLGGQVATKLALTYPERASALVTLASNPHFVAMPDWPGMAPATFSAFCEDARQRPAPTLRRFQGLQASGSAQPRDLIRELSALHTGEGGDLPAAGLAWLAELDTRGSLQALNIPQLHLLAGADAMVPATTADRLQALLADRPAARVETLDKASHLLPLEHPAALAARLHSACEEWGLLDPVAATPVALDKRDVAASFSRAATGYDSMARLQRDVGLALLERSEASPAVVRDVLDLGSGTGYFCPALRERFPAATYTGLDIAEGMAHYAREHHPGQGQWLVGDAEALPLAAESVDFVFSSLAIQWCLNPAALLAELLRVLRPGGRCVFATLGPATLDELRSAWAAVDAYQHVNEFLPASALEEGARRLRGAQLHLATRAFRMDYDSVRELLLELKTIGAHNVNQRRPGGLTSPATLRRMMAAYEDFRIDGRLPASYEVIFGELEKR